MLSFCVMFTLGMTLNKLVDPSIPTSLKVFIRSCFGLAFFIPIIFKEKKKIFYSNSIGLQLTRIMYMSLAMGGTYYTYSHLPFTMATSIGFTGPIFTAILSVFILKDRLNLDQWLAILTGYIGVLCMTHPHGSLNNSIYIAILSNIFSGLSIIYAKKLTPIDSRNTIVILGNIGMVFISLIWTLLYGFMHAYSGDTIINLLYLLGWKDVFILMGMGFLGALSQLSYVTALKYSSPGFLAPFEYSRLVIALPIGLLLGDAFPGYLEFIGIFIIMTSTLYLSWKGLRRG